MSLSNIERETGINYNDEEKFAIVYTANEPLKIKLDGLCVKYPKDFKHISLGGDNDGIKCYHVPKNRVCITAPKVFSEATKKRMKEQGKTLAKNRGATIVKTSRLNKKQKEV